MKKLTIIMASMLTLAACTGGRQEKVPALDLGNLDTTVAPGTDFYRYATGGWQKNNPLKPEYSRFGSFDVLNERNDQNLNDLFASMTKLKTRKGTVEQKIADLYKMGLDSLRLNKEGAEPILDDLGEIYLATDKKDLMRVIAKAHSAGEAPFFYAYVEADMTDSGNQILYMGQAGLGIGDRDYYIDPANDAIKQGYRKFLETIFDLVGNANPAAAAANAIAVEDDIAANAWTREQKRNIPAQYNPMSTAELQAAYPGIPFDVYFETRGIPAQDKLVVGEPSSFEALSKYYEAADLDVLKDYVAAQVISGACGALSDDFYMASFEFFSRQMAGVQEPKPRWKRAMRVPNGVLGEAVGKMYVERYFPESSKNKMLALVKNLQASLGEHIDHLDWMGDSTKVKAHEKLSNFIVKIGYPDKWKDYSSLEIDPARSYYDNLKAASVWHVADNLAKLGKPTDKTEWGMTPQTVNAYYNPTTNEICFPAAILQPPFFNPDADDPVNYGAIGVVIGHEMSHGFDDQGRLFDKDGNMVSWWTDADDAAFRAKAEILAAQFDAVEVLPGLMANGHFTMGENIGDHGGISIAYDAMKKAIEGKPREEIDGFTPEQRFFLGYATVWAQNITDEEKARLTRMDPHSLAVNRVNVSLRNFPQFFEAFGIKEGDPMFRPAEEQVHIW